MFVNVLSCVLEGGEEKRRVNIMYVCVVCVEDVKDRACFILILWICRVLDVLVTLELDSQYGSRTTE